MTKYILASASPRRRKLLEDAGIEFEILLPCDEENIGNSFFTYEKVEKTAGAKGLSVINKVKIPSIIISADTVVVSNDIIMGKPTHFDDAFRMLKKLCNNTHKVVTSICLTNSITKEQTVRSVTTEVRFKEVDDEKIKEYIYKFRPYDKAGAYGIQELDKCFIEDIKGDYNNVVGLPVDELKKLMEEVGGLFGKRQ